MYRKIKSAIACAAFAGVLVVPAANATPDRISVTATPIPLYQNRPEDNQAGKLRYISGIAIKSDHEFFGGISGLAINKSGQRFIAITDQGAYLKGLFSETAPGHLTGLKGVKIDKLKNYQGDQFEKKRIADAESIIDLSDGSLTGPFIVSFEFMHRAVVYNRIDGPTVRALPLPPADADVPSNGGMEALAKLNDGRLIALTEDMLDDNGNHVGWIVDGITAHAFSFVTNDGFSPTDMAVLPDGDVLVLERSFSPFAGVGMQIRRIKADDIQAGETVDGPVLTRLNRSANIDNMEAMDVRLTDDGRTLLYIMSDDNFKMVQRTVLMVFELPNN